MAVTETVTHTVLQFKLFKYELSLASRALCEIEKLLMRYGLQGRVIETFRSSCKPLFTIIAEGGRYTVEAYGSGLICVDVVQHADSALIKEFSSLEESISEVITARIPQRSFLVHKGAAPYHVYFMTSDDEVEQMKFTQQLYSARSSYQQIDIYHSEEFGVILFLDYNNNIAESDFIYTKTLTGNGQYDMGNSSILILGGGDGAALKEVLTYDPKMVIMVEIDKMVIDAVQEHMRVICGDVLDQMKGDNYEIIIGDCVPVMKQFIEMGKMFDYILYDLTQAPISTSEGKEWEQLVHSVLDLAIRLLTPSGRCLAQGHSACCTKSSNLFEQQMKQLTCPVEFSKGTALIPSYRQAWMFYTIWRR